MVTCPPSSCLESLISATRLSSPIKSNNGRLEIYVNPISDIASRVEGKVTCLDLVSVPLAPDCIERDCIYQGGLWTPYLSTNEARINPETTETEYWVDCAIDTDGNGWFIRVSSLYPNDNNDILELGNPTLYVVNTDDNYIVTEDISLISVNLLSEVRTHIPVLEEDYIYIDNKGRFKSDSFIYNKNRFYQLIKITESGVSVEATVYEFENNNDIPYSNFKYDRKYTEIDQTIITDINLLTALNLLNVSEYISKPDTILFNLKGSIPLDIKNYIENMAAAYLDYLGSYSLNDRNIILPSYLNKITSPNAYGSNTPDFLLLNKESHLSSMALMLILLIEHDYLFKANGVYNGYINTLTDNLVGRYTHKNLMSKGMSSFIESIEESTLIEEYDLLTNVLIFIALMKSWDRDREVTVLIKANIILKGLEDNLILFRENSIRESLSNSNIYVESLLGLLILAIATQRQDLFDLFDLLVTDNINPLIFNTVYEYSKDSEGNYILDDTGNKVYEEITAANDEDKIFDNPLGINFINYPFRSVNLDKESINLANLSLLVSLMEVNLPKLYNLSNRGIERVIVEFKLGLEILDYNNPLSLSLCVDNNLGDIFSVNYRDIDNFRVNIQLLELKVSRAIPIGDYWFNSNDLYSTNIGNLCLPAVLIFAALKTKLWKNTHISSNVYLANRYDLDILGINYKLMRLRQQSPLEYRNELINYINDSRQNTDFGLNNLSLRYGKRIEIIDAHTLSLKLNNESYKVGINSLLLGTMSSPALVYIISNGLASSDFYRMLKNNFSAGIVVKVITYLSFYNEELYSIDIYNNDRDVLYLETFDNYPEYYKDSCLLQTHSDAYIVTEEEYGIEVECDTKCYLVTHDNRAVFTQEYNLIDVACEKLNEYCDELSFIDELGEGSGVQLTSCVKYPWEETWLISSDGIPIIANLVSVDETGQITSRLEKNIKARSSDDSIIDFVLGMLSYSVLDDSIVRTTFVVGTLDYSVLDIDYFQPLPPTLTYSVLDDTIFRVTPSEGTIEYSVLDTAFFRTIIPYGIISFSPLVSSTFRIGLAEMSGVDFVSYGDNLRLDNTNIEIYQVANPDYVETLEDVNINNYQSLSADFTETIENVNISNYQL